MMGNLNLLHIFNTSHVFVYSYQSEGHDHAAVFPHLVVILPACTQPECSKIIYNIAQILSYLHQVGPCCLNGHCSGSRKWFQGFRGIKATWEKVISHEKIGF